MHLNEDGQNQSWTKNIFDDGTEFLMKKIDPESVEQIFIFSKT